MDEIYRERLSQGVNSSFYVTFNTQRESEAQFFWVKDRFGRVWIWISTPSVCSVCVFYIHDGGGKLFVGEEGVNTIDTDQKQKKKKRSWAIQDAATTITMVQISLYVDDTVQFADDGERFRYDGSSGRIFPL